MKPVLSGFVVLALLLALQSQAMAKKKPPPPPPQLDTYVVFYATGTFGSTGSLTGTVTIDTTTGEAVSVDLAVGGGVAVFNGTPSTSTNSSGNVVISIGFLTGIQLVIPSTSLKGYAGGSLVGGGPYIADESAWWWPAYSWGDPGRDPLLDGSLEP
jgi:hypothetical protein